MKTFKSPTCKAKSKAGTKTCEKRSGHRREGDLRHREGAWEWGR